MPSSPLATRLAAAAAVAAAAWLLTAPPSIPPLDVATSSLEEEETETLGGVELRHRSALLTSGARLHFVEAGDASGPLVLLVHGFPDSCLSFLAQLPALAAAGYRCIAPDLRGFGRSSAPSSVRAYTAATLVADLVALLDVLECDSAVVVGHDWGGVVAYALATLAPGRVRRLSILNCPHPRIFARTLRTSSAQRARSWYMFVFQCPRLPEFLLAARDHTALRRALASEVTPPTPPALVERYVELYRRSGWRGPLNYYRSIYAGGWKLPRDAVIACPVLVLWGTADKYLQASMAEPPVDTVPNARVVRLAGVGHWCHWDASTEVNAHLLAFLRE